MLITVEVVADFCIHELSWRWKDAESLF